jgi:hypothetical protein
MDITPRPMRGRTEGHRTAFATVRGGMISLRTGKITGNFVNLACPVVGSDVGLTAYTYIMKILFLQF